jgi:alanine racemase
VETASARAQCERFADAVGALAAAGIRPPHVHLANSAAVLAEPAAHFTMVRPGLMLYGYAPAPHLTARAALRPAMRLRTAVAQARRVPAGTPVGYGGTWVARRDSVIATLPLGYADGYHRTASNRGAMLVRGRLVPIAGRVCMDHIMLDVTDVPDVAAGDPVTAFGPHAITADDVAGWSETIAYEVLTSIGKRVPRVHVEEFDG